MAEPVSVEIGERSRNPHVDTAASYFVGLSRPPFTNFNPAIGVGIADKCQQSGEDPAVLGQALLGDTARINRLVAAANIHHAAIDLEMPPLTTDILTNAIDRAFDILRV